MTWFKLTAAILIYHELENPPCWQTDLLRINIDFYAPLASPMLWAWLAFHLPPTVMTTVRSVDGLFDKKIENGLAYSTIQTRDHITPFQCLSILRSSVSFFEKIGFNCKSGKENCRF